MDARLSYLFDINNKSYPHSQQLIGFHITADKKTY